MRIAILIVPLLLSLTACKDEPDFDARFDQAAREIDARARAMDADIEELDAAAAAGSESLPRTDKPTIPATSSGE